VAVRLEVSSVSAWAIFTYATTMTKKGSRNRKMRVQIVYPSANLEDCRRHCALLHIASDLLSSNGSYRIMKNIGLERRE